MFVIGTSEKIGMNFRCIILCCSLLCVLFAPLLSPAVAQQQTQSVQLLYRDGTILTGQFVDPTLLWTDVSESGQMTKIPIEVNKIKSLTLTLEPASANLADVLKLISDLDSDDFFVREEAEQRLKKAGSKFRSMIERNTKMKTPDGTYRLKRVLSSMKSNSTNSEFALDVLKLADGKKLTGDAGNKSFDFVFQGDRKVSVARNMIERISRANPELTTRPAGREVVETKLFHNHARFMKTPGLRLVDFQSRPDGSSLRSLDKNISDSFVDFGLKLGTEYPMGCVGISGYDIKGGDRPVGGNSVCVYQSKTRKVKRFQGVMEITFCQPGKKNVPHGVNNIGMFLSRVTHSRDLLVEAYDVTDRLIGVCESSDEPCTFCGISSTVPIARVRVLSNPWMLELRKLNAPEDKRAGQKVDQDFAVDSVMFSNPVPVDSLRKDRHFLGRNGDMVAASWVRIFEKDRIELASRSIKLLSVGLDAANTIVLKPIPKTLPNRRSDKAWMAMLSDNSIVRWNPTAPLKSTTLGQDLDHNEVIAIWPAIKKPQLPLAGDFDDGPRVIVYPGCRVVGADVEFDGKGYRWTKGEVRAENLHEENEQKVDQRSDDLPDKVAPRKKSYSFDVSSLPEYETPTIWFKQPTMTLASQGVIRLDAGEMLVYGKDALFQLKSIDARQITITFGEKELSIPLGKVVSIAPPQE